MQEPDYDSVVSDNKLANGLVFGLPVVYDTSDERVVPGKKVLLSYKGKNIATLQVCTVYKHERLLIFEYRVISLCCL